MEIASGYREIARGWLGGFSSFSTKRPWMILASLQGSGMATPVRRTPLAETILATPKGIWPDPNCGIWSWGCTRKNVKALGSFSGRSLCSRKSPLLQIRRSTTLLPGFLNPYSPPSLSHGSKRPAASLFRPKHCRRGAISAGTAIPSHTAEDISSSALFITLALP